MPRAVAFDLGPIYLGAHLSDNVAETPEGYRICRNAVIGRSGFQTYRVGELTDPDGLLADRTSADEIEVWRDPDEVFAKATLASFEGKTFTIAHPGDLLSPENEQEHHAGHVQNVRRGTEPLESGDWPMLADIIVTHRDAIRAIDAGERQLSCGYTYQLAREGHRFDQRKIVGNHVALVPKGRAGHEARINDAAPSKELPVKNMFKHIFGLGMKEYAKDAKPEEFSEVIEEIRKETEARSKANDSASGEPEKEKAKAANEGHDGAAAMDQKAKDRKKMHDALDKQLDSAEAEAASKSEEDDAALDALKTMFASKDAEAHPEDCKCADCMDKGKDAAQGKVEESQDGEVTSPEPVLAASEVPQSQMDSALTLIKALKPFIAKSTDKKLKAAFDTAVATVNAAKKQEAKTGGSYAEFTAASHSRGNDSFEESFAQKQARANDEMYAKELKSRSAAFRGEKR